MGKVRQRGKGGPEKSDKKRTKKERSSRADNAVKESSSCVSKCLAAFLFVLLVIATIAVVGFYNSPFKALPITDYVKEIKLEGKFEVNEKIAEGTR